MKRRIGASGLLLVAGCGVFGSEEPAGEAPPVEGGQRPPEAIGGQAPDGVFVSSSLGSETGQGSPVSPLQTLKTAMETAKLRNKPVIACAEDFNESIELVDGVSIYGYYDCKTWTRTAARAKIKGAPYKPVITATSLTQPTRIEGFDVTNAGAGDVPPGTSSIAVSVRDSKGLVFGEMSIQAGDAAPGKDGVEPEKGNELLGDTVNGWKGWAQRYGCNTTFELCHQIQFEQGSGGGYGTCAVGPTPGRGGDGGDGAFMADGVPRATVEHRGRPLVATPETNAGGQGLGGSDLSVIRGKDGNTGAHGDNGKNGTWSFSATRFLPGDGTKGVNGSPGQGGGGGGGAKYWICSNGLECSGSASEYYWRGATGAGGGSGGCGGLVGTPGSGGGASVALFVVASELELEGVAVRSGKGGRAGKGALGTAGTAGGTGGPGGGAGYGSGGAGGRGGPGGNAGFAGHGAPGPTIALAWTGTRPEMDAKTELVPGAAADGQPASTRGDQPALPAVVGDVKAEHSF